MTKQEQIDAIARAQKELSEYTQEQHRLHMQILDLSEKLGNLRAQLKMLLPLNTAAEALHGKRKYRALVDINDPRVRYQACWCELKGAAEEMRGIMYKLNTVEYHIRLIKSRIANFEATEIIPERPRQWALIGGAS